MKTSLLTLIATSQLLVTHASAGVNGTYRVSGTETEIDAISVFTGTVKITNYRKGTYDLKFSDGEKASFTFTFVKPLKETTSSQTVSCVNSKGTGTATFYRKNGATRVKFTYKAKAAHVTVTGKGSGKK